MDFGEGASRAIMNEIAILVVTYNRKKLLQENIEAILKQTYGKFDYFICDNASIDGTRELVEACMENDGRIHYDHTGANLGGAGGFSYGLKKIVKKGYQYCWMMDDDAVPEPDALERLVRAAELLGKDDFSFLASTVLWTDGTPCKMNQYTIQTNVYDHLRATQNGLLPIERCSFVGCFVNLDCTRKVGLPIKEFFIYGDDTEYTLRLSQCKNAYMCSGSVIIHKMSVNVRIGVAEALAERIPRYEYEYRNKIYIYRNHNGFPWIKILLRYGKECAKVLIRSKDNKGKRIGVIIKGFFRGLFFHPPIESV